MTKAHLSCPSRVRVTRTRATASVSSVHFVAAMNEVTLPPHICHAMATQCFGNVTLSSEPLSLLRPSRFLSLGRRFLLVIAQSRGTT
eukprot:2529118-Rhodomonas_salina.2